MSEVPDTQKAVYRSTHPEVLAAWDDTQQRHRELAEKVKALRAEFPNHPPMVYRYSDRAQFSHLSFHEDMPSIGNDFGPPPEPEGWRIKKEGRSTYLGWVPDKRTKAGKAMAARLAEIKVTGMGHFPGMPTTVLEGNHWYSHGSVVHDGVAYAHWGCSFADVESSNWSRGLDTDMWQRCRMSEFWMAKEAHDAESAEVDA